MRGNLKETVLRSIITKPALGKQNVQAEEVYYAAIWVDPFRFFFIILSRKQVLINRKRLCNYKTSNVVGIVNVI